MHEKTAFITGASSGLGRALAERLASRGTHVVIAARREDALEDVRRGIEARGGKATVVPLDVCDPDRAVAEIQRVDDDLGGLDLVIANAGIGGLEHARDVTWKSTAQTLQVNVVGAFATLTAVLGRMVTRRRGHLVGVSSLASYRGLPQSAAYSATKAALSIFLEGLRVDLHGSGVAITDVRPGFVRTPIDRGQLAEPPFMMEVEPAIDAILAGIDARRAVVAFPFPLAQLAALSRYLPDALYDIAVRRASPV